MREATTESETVNLVQLEGCSACYSGKKSKRKNKPSPTLPTTPSMACSSSCAVRSMCSLDQLESADSTFGTTRLWKRSEPGRFLGIAALAKHEAVLGRKGQKQGAFLNRGTEEKKSEPWTW